MKPRESTLPLRAFTTEWTAFCSEGVISKCAAKMLSLVGRVEPIEGVAVPDPRAELGAIVARVTCGPRPVSSLGTVDNVERGKAPSSGFSFASWDIVAAMVVEERRGSEGLLVRVISRAEFQKVDPFRLSILRYGTVLRRVFSYGQDSFYHTGSFRLVCVLGFLTAARFQPQTPTISKAPRPGLNERSNIISRPARQLRCAGIDECQKNAAPVAT